jgi:hypothetical protein
MVGNACEGSTPLECCSGWRHCTAIMTPNLKSIHLWKNVGIWQPLSCGHRIKAWTPKLWLWVGYIFRQVSHSWTQDWNFVMGNLNYIGVLKEILVVDYACLPMVLFTCSWIPTNTQGNATIRQDEHGFWVVNLARRLPPMVEPYVFPTSMIQVKAWVTPYVLIMNK